MSIKTQMERREKLGINNLIVLRIMSIPAVYFLELKMGKMARHLQHYEDGMVILVVRQ